MDEIEQLAESQVLGGEFLINIEESDGEEDEDRPSYLMMEMMSTVSFKEVDIDKMLEHTTLDDFLRGLYINPSKDGPLLRHQPTEEDKMMKYFMEGKGVLGEESSKKRAPILSFEDKEVESEFNMFKGDNLRKQALANLREIK